MLKGTILKTSLISLLVILCINIVPFNIIKAENNGTYKIVLANNCTPLYVQNNKTVAIVNNIETRGVIIYDDDTNFSLYAFVSLSNGSYNSTNDINNGCPVPSYNFANKNYQGHYYYVSGFLGYKLSNNDLSNLPIIHVNVNGSDSGFYNNAYKYTYGDNAEDPTIYDFGNVIPKFSTQFVSNNQEAFENSAPYNKDTIYWDTSKSDNGSTLYNSDLLDFGYTVEVRANRFYYTSVTKNSILVQTLQDMHLLDAQVITLGTYDLATGSVSYTWGEIANKFIDYVSYSDFFGSIPIKLIGDHYISYGWFYEVRLRYDRLNYISDWKPVYNTTASPEANDIIYNEYYTNYNYNYNYKIDNSIQTINEYNGSNSTYYINSEVINQNITEENTINNNTYNRLSEVVNKFNEQEHNFNDDLNNSLNDINVEDFDFSTWGSKFQNSAQWVKTQFDRMTTNTPIGSFLGFSLIVGLALLIMGRVFK